MQFEWDEQKNAANFRKHKLSFANVADVFNAPMLIMMDDRADYGEERFLGIGLLKGRVVVVVYTEPAPTVIRIISLRKAVRYEQRLYEQYIRHRLGGG